jgi:citrate lyase subunit beta / citryl-CoA lyase
MDRTGSLARARSFLFVPGNRPERFAKALAAGADAVVLDLEDAVPPPAKPQAREALRSSWAELVGAPVPLVVRINTPGTPAGDEDLELLARLPGGPAAVMVPKAESAAMLGAVSRVRPGVPLLPLVESAAGYANLATVAAAPGVLRLVVGHIDFVADLGLQCSDDERELVPLRFAVALQTRLNRLASAVDGVTVAVDDVARLAADTRRALAFGFGAKLCIHPKQVAGVHQALAPTAEQVAWARRVVEADAAAAGAAVMLDGRMVDLPVVLQARQILARAG